MPITRIWTWLHVYVELGHYAGPGGLWELGLLVHQWTWLSFFTHCVIGTKQSSGSNKRLLGIDKGSRFRRELGHVNFPFNCARLVSEAKERLCTLAELNMNEFLPI